MKRLRLSWRSDIFRSLKKLSMKKNKPAHGVRRSVSVQLGKIAQHIVAQGNEAAVTAVA